MVCATIHDEIGDAKGWKKETGLANAMVRETGWAGEDGKDMRELPVQLH